MKNLFKMFVVVASLIMLTACDVNDDKNDDLPSDIAVHEIIRVYVSIDDQLIVESYNGSANTFGKIDTVKHIEISDDGYLLITYNDDRVENAGALITYLENPYVERRVTDRYIQWRKIGEDRWYNLIALDLLTMSEFD